MCSMFTNLFELFLTSTQKNSGVLSMQAPLLLLITVTVYAIRSADPTDTLISCLCRWPITGNHRMHAKHTGAIKPIVALTIVFALGMMTHKIRPTITKQNDQQESPSTRLLGKSSIIQPNGPSPRRMPTGMSILSSFLPPTGGGVIGVVGTADKSTGSECSVAFFSSERSFLRSARRGFAMPPFSHVRNRFRPALRPPKRLRNPMRKTK